MTTPKISSAAVSRVLTAAGLTKSTTASTRVRGWSSSTPGFYVESRTDGSVQVWWTGVSNDRTDHEMGTATNTLIAKGYVVQRISGSGIAVTRSAA